MLTVFVKVSHQEKAPLYSCPTLDLREDADVCVEPKCIDVPSRQHKTSNLKTTIPNCVLLLSRSKRRQSLMQIYLENIYRNMDHCVQ